MPRPSPLSLASLVIVVASPFLLAQSGPMTNADVVLMVTNKLDEKMILTAIDSAPTTAFDVSAAGLVKLYKPTPDGKVRLRDKVILEVQKVAALKQPRLKVTNTDVIAMIAGDLSQAIVMQAIDNAGSIDFDVSPQGLVNLKLASVSDVVAAHMQQLAIQKSAPAASMASSTPSSAPSASPKPAAVPQTTASRTPPNSNAASTTGAGNGPAALTVGSAIPQNLKDGEPATFTTDLSVTAATNKVKAYFNSKNVDFTLNSDTNRVISDWFNERRCGPGIQHCANRANVRISADAGHTIITVQVFERKREGGLSEKPWHENATSKGKETAQTATAIQAFLRTP